jgi:site-specific recombinase XerD
VEGNAPASPDDERLLAAYMRTLTSPATKRTYNTEVRMFLSYLGGEMGRGLGEATAEDVSFYREHLLGRYAPATAAKKLSALRRFLTFAYMVGAARVSPEALKFFAKSPKVAADPAYEVLSEEELGRLLSAAKTASEEAVGRDYALLATMAGMGLREAEVVGILLGDFREAGEGTVLLRVRGKGGKVRAVPVAPELWSLLQRYALTAGRSLASPGDARRPLFPSRERDRWGREKPLTTRAVRYIVKRHARAAGITKPISPHSLRHTVGTNMALNEAPLLVIQQFLGHSDPKTTLRYVRRAEEVAAKAYTYNTLPL